MSECELLLFHVLIMDLEEMWYGSNFISCTNYIDLSNNYF